MYLELDGSGPLHGQLTRALKSAMYTGSVHVGARLPATRLLARELGISRNTVLAAYEQLRAEGFVDGRVGSGSYVTPPLQSMASAPVPAEPIEPQSAYARRSREYQEQARFFRQRPPPARYAFHYASPSTNPTLTSAWARELSHAALYTPPGYPTAQGLPALRAAVCDYLGRRRGVQAQPDDILIVGGTQQAMALTARVLLDEGADVAIEDPQYSAIRTVLKVHGARLTPIPVDEQGLRVDMLPNKPPRLVCVSPSHQFPMGSVLSLSRRMALLEYAHRHKCWIFEDDYDGEFRYDTKPLAALRSLDDAGRVIYIGTFSKALFPSVRLGYIVMPTQLRSDFIIAKWLDDFGAPTVEQAALANFMANGGFERHLRRTAKTLKERRTVLLDGLRRHAGDRIEIADSHAGMHLVAWLRGKNREQGEAFIAHARTLDMELTSVSQFCIDPPDRAGLLLGFASMSVNEIEQAVLRFARCLDEMQV
ncbi:PLP-dependent aminotransferase family protein [Luteimonas sp. SX5]|uniref:PLP-dependent aminotransferase family protein n=1 Tax=Luteimonas galliterrae TaxID=2940486 RepID=A0ABT0MJF9_9GAMM|nr:PLP-dependent aminotransferase family protein [Luteimonas galliterrae]MCL1634420.1 PLP-dependent aminotransferase family protein [Luteimonas galliterrae]